MSAGWKCLLQVCQTHDQQRMVSGMLGQSCWNSMAHLQPTAEAMISME